MVKQSAAKRWAAIRIKRQRPWYDTLANSSRLQDSFSIEPAELAKETSLALGYQIITAKHGGHLRFESKLDQGHVV